MKEPTNEQLLANAMLALDTQVRGTKALKEMLGLAAQALAESSPIDRDDPVARGRHRHALEQVHQGAQCIASLEPIPPWVLAKLADPRATLPTTRKARMLEKLLGFLFLSHLLLIGCMWFSWTDADGAIRWLLALWIGSLVGLGLASRSWNPIHFAD